MLYRLLVQDVALLNNSVMPSTILFGQGPSGEPSKTDCSAAFHAVIYARVQWRTADRVRKSSIRSQNPKTSSPKTVPIRTRGRLRLSRRKGPSKRGFRQFLREFVSPKVGREKNTGLNRCDNRNALIRSRPVFLIANDNTVVVGRTQYLCW